MSTVEETLDQIDDLKWELVATVGDDDVLEAAAGVVASWAVFANPHVYEPVAPVRLCRRGLVDGRALELEYLTFNAEQMERVAEAIRRLVANTESRHPRARRRARRQALAVSKQLSRPGVTGSADAGMSHHARGG